VDGRSGRNRCKILHDVAYSHLQANDALVRILYWKHKTWKVPLELVFVFQCKPLYTLESMTLLDFTHGAPLCESSIIYHRKQY